MTLEQQQQARRESTRRWRARNPQKIKEYDEKNKTRDRARTTKWRKENPERAKAAVKRWTAKNPDRVHERGIRNRHGISLIEYHALLKKQGGGCAICGVAPGKKRLSVDHCHKDYFACNVILVLDSFEMTLHSSIEPLHI